MRAETMTSKQRIDAAIRLEKPDRVPVVPMISNVSAAHAGISMRRFYEDPQACMDAQRKTFLDLGGLDAMLMGGPTSPDVFKSGMPLRVKAPGKELPDDAVMQIDESQALMMVEEYDVVASKGWDWTFANVIVPRRDPDAPRGLIGKIQGFLHVLPTIRGAQADAKWYAQHGAQVLVGAPMLMPFELFCMGRTVHQFYMDLFRMPEKVIAASDAALPEIVKSAITVNKRAGAPWVFIGGTRGSSAMIGPKQFEKFYLPYLKKAVDEIIAAGLVPLFHFDSDWTGFLPYFREMPRGKCVLELDSATDIFKAKDTLRGHMCLMGDVAATLLKLGTPQQVIEYTKKLIDCVGGDGGFILSTGCDAPHDAKWENLKAMVDTGKTYELSR